MNKVQEAFMWQLDSKKYMQLLTFEVNNQVADTILVNITCDEMAKKLEKKRDEGRGGWFGTSCSNRQLKKMLHEHVEKGDMIDVMNIAAMIYMRSELYGDDA